MSGGYDNSTYLGRAWPKGMTSHQRFMLSWKFDEKTGCWNWIGYATPKGYGVLKTKGTTATRAHRYSFEYYVGTIQPGQIICHRCDNPGCVNPMHLFAGTHQDNSDDKVAKGRQAKGEKLSHPRASGERNAQAKLKRAQIEFIRADERPQRAIAADYGVSQPAISKIKRGENWK